MKKFLSLALSAGLFAIVACGPAAEEKKAETNAAADSVMIQELEKAEAPTEVAATPADTTVKTEAAH